MRYLWASVGFACAISGAGAALAQDQPLTRNDPAAALPPASTATEELQVDEAEASDAASEGQLGFVVQNVTFNGARSLTADQLRPSWEPLRGRSATLADLRAAAARAEKIYAEQGYPFVAVLVPPQEVRDGQVRFDVVEGRISDVTVIGNDPVARRQAAAAFAGLTTKTPLSSNDVEASYELARQIPGLALSGALRRGSEAGGMNLVVQPRRKGWRAYANVNNLFSEPVGPWGVLVGVDFYGASTYGDQTTIQYYTTFDSGEQEVLRLGHSRRLNASGLTVGINYLWAQSNPQGVVAPLDLATDVRFYHAEISQPLISRAWGGLVATGGLDWSDQQTDVFSTIGISEDRTRILSGRLAGRWSDPGHALSGWVEGRQGLDIGDASQPGDLLLSRAEGDPQAFVLRGGGDAEVKIQQKWTVYGRVEAQWSDGPLLAPDEYSAGNLSIGRGYEPGSAFGDQALAFVLESRWGPYGFGGGAFQASPFVFYDQVSYRNDDTTGVRQRTIASAGVGLRLEARGKGRLDFVWAKPLDPPLGLGEKTPGSSLLVNLTVSFDDAIRWGWSRTRSGASR
jgi:hemolysin activation/secretion protein